MFMARATRSTYNVSFRRRREGKTNYTKRNAMLSSGACRLVVRKTSRYVTAQVVSYSDEGDRIISSASSKDLASFGLPPLKNVVSAYLVGYWAAKKAAAKGTKKSILDIGRRTPTKSMFAFAALKGALDAGMEIPHSKDVFDDERFSGKHIAEYAKSLKDSNPELYSKVFSAYVGKGIFPESLPGLVDDIKSKM